MRNAGVCLLSSLVHTVIYSTDSICNLLELYVICTEVCSIISTELSDTSKKMEALNKKTTNRAYAIARAQLE